MPFNERELAALQEAETLLRYGADRDHWCDEDDCCEDNPKCHEMHVIAGLAAMRRAIEPPHESLQKQRLENDSERIYAEHWKRANERLSHVNGGFTLIEWILCPSGQRSPDRVTHRDAEVAASIIQWLGTNCGLSFVRECEREIDQTRAQREVWALVVNFNKPADKPELESATLLAGRFAAHQAHKIAVYEIAAALMEAKEAGRREVREQLSLALSQGEQRGEGKHGN